MSEHDAASKDDILSIAHSFEVSRMNLMVSAKRTVKVDDEYRSYESSVSWTMTHPSFTSVSPEVAKAAALIYTPMLARKVFTDLVVGGVMLAEAAKVEIERIERMYKQLLEGKKREGSSGGSQGQGDLQRAGGDVSGPPSELTTRV